MTNRNIQERVAAGAAFLDRHVPGWRDRVNPATLNIASVRTCVVGQLFDRDFVKGLGALGLTKGRLRSTYGFAFQNDDPITENRSLTAAWRREIARRKAA